MPRLTRQEKLPYWQEQVTEHDLGVVEMIEQEALRRFGQWGQPASGRQALEILFQDRLTRTVMQWIWALDPVALRAAAGQHAYIEVLPVNSGVWKAWEKGKIDEALITDVHNRLLDESDTFNEAGEPYVIEDARTLVLILDRDSGKFLVLAVERSGDWEVQTLHPLIDLLYRQRLDRNFNRAKRVRASSISTCQRQVFFEIGGFKKEDTSSDNPHWKVVGDIGTVFHEVLEELMGSSPMVSRQEFSVEIEGVFGGKVDAEITVDGQPYVLDWKTIGQRDFKLGAGGPKFKKYYDQLSSYGNVLGVHKAVVILVNRNTFELSEVGLDLKPEHGEKLIKKAHETLEFVKNRRVPRAEILGSYECNFCPFQTQCYLQEQDLVVQTLLDQGVSPAKI